MFEVGYKADVRYEVCRGKPECEEKANQPIIPGEIYEVEIGVDPPIKPDEVYKIVDVVSKIRSDYPAININYLWISDDGSKVIVQFFDDPEVRPEVGVTTIIFVALLIVAAIAFAWSANTVLEAIRRTFMPGGQPPPSWMWYIFAIIGIGIGTSLIGYGISKTAWSIRGGKK